MGGDQTLSDFDIIYEAQRHCLLVPSGKARLKGASHDIRVGGYAIMVHPEEGGGM